MDKRLKDRLAIVVAAVLLASCSGNGSGQSNNCTDNGDATTLQVITPKNIYSKNVESATGYVIVKNPTNSAIKNLHYSLSNLVGSGSSVNIDNASAADCANVAAYSQCNVKLNIPAGAIAGSLAFNFNNIDKTTTVTSLQYNINSLMQIGIEQAHYNTIAGIDGISINYYNTVISGVPYVLINGIVASNNAGTFNNIVLVNNTGSIIPNQQLISGPVNSSQGATFSILLPAPTGINATQTFKIQTQLVESDGTISSKVNSDASHTLSTTSEVGIANMLPETIFLTASNPQQILTFANTGDNIAQLQKLVASDPNIEVIFTPQQLSSGATTTATLKLRNTTTTVQSGSMTLDYNNGKNETSVAGDVNQNITPQPSPAPTPTPSPTPPVPPTPTAGLLTDLTPDSDFFKTTNGAPVSRQLTLTNSGNTTENNFVLTLPANFTISAGSSNSCTVTQASSPATISDSLAATTGSCTVTVTYSNSTATPQAVGNISIAYNYNNGTAATSKTIPVNYRVTQSSANLSLTPSTTQTYPSITSNNSDVSTIITYTLTNSGDDPATNLAFNFAGTNPDLFHVVTGGTCIEGGSLSNANGSNTCTINTQFGPAANGSVGNKTATFTVAYTPYNGGATANTSVISLNGNVTAAPSASYSVAYSSTDFTSGTGTSTIPYQGYTNTNYMITVTYTNNSAIAATGFTTSAFTASDGFSKTVAAPGSACNNVSMPANGGTCSDTYTLNSGATGNHSLNLANVTTSWSDSSGSYSAQAVTGAPTIDITLIDQTVSVNVTSVTPSKFVLNTAADGQSQSKSLALHYDTITESTATLSLTYQNSGTIDATSFTSSIATFPTGWSRTTHGCNNVTLTANNGNNCIDIYNFTSKPSAGVIALTKPDGTSYSTNFNINNVKLSWNSSIGNVSNQTPSSITSDSNASGIIYTNYFLQIFVSSNTHNGNFATDSTNVGTGFVSGQPITNADALCANDSNKPNDGYTYKALLSYGTDTATAVQGTNRFACGGTPTSAPCVGTNVTAGFDWVLRPGYVQYRSVNSENVNTVANTLADYGVTSTSARPGNFGISSPTWTGLSNASNYQWTSSTTSNCNGWSDGSSDYTGVKGQPGNAAAAYSPIYSSSSLNCNSTFALYCVQQVN